MATILTRHERHVLQMAADGLTGAEIAEQLCMTIHGVNAVFLAIYRSLGIGERVASRQQRKEAIRQFLTGEALE